MENSSTSQNTGNQCTSILALSPHQNHKNRFAILSNLNCTNINDNTENIDTEIEEAKPKIPYLYIYEINDYIELLNKETIIPNG